MKNIYWALVVYASLSGDLARSADRSPPEKFQMDDVVEFDPSKASLPAKPAYQRLRTVGPGAITGEDATNSPRVDATIAGFSTLGEYLKNAPELQREQQAASTDLAAFKKKMAKLEAEYRQAEQEYARKETETRNALARLDSNPNGEQPPPVASRNPPAQDMPYSAPAAPMSFPSFSGSPGAQPNYAEPLAQPMAQAAVAAKAEIPVADFSSFEGKLDSKPSPLMNRQSTIAVMPAEEKGEVANRLQLAKGGKVNTKGKSALRDTIKAALARKAAAAGATGKGVDADSESGSQSATRSLLEEARSLASVNAAQGQSGSSGAGFGQSSATGEEFKMVGSETAEEVARLQSEVHERQAQAAPEVLGKESLGLFERVRVAHLRSQKDGRVSVVRR